MDQEKEGSIPNFPSMEDKSRVKSRSSLELRNKGAYEGGLMVWKSRIPWAKQPLPQAGPVPELGGAGDWMEPQGGGAPGAATWSRCCQAQRWAQDPPPRIRVSLRVCNNAASSCIPLPSGGDFQRKMGSKLILKLPYMKNRSQHFL